MNQLLSFLFTALRGVTQNRVIGRKSAGTGRAELLDGSDLRTIASVYSTAEVDDEISAFGASLASVYQPIGSYAAATHSHTTADITGFAEAVDDEVASLLVAGTNITVTYNDAANTLTIASTASGIGGSTGASDNRLLRSDGTGGATLQASGITIDDSNNVSGVANVTLVSGGQIRSAGTFSSALACIDGFNAGTGFVWTGHNITTPALNYYMEGSGEWTLRHRAAGSMSWTNGNNAATGSRTLVVSRQSDGVLQIGTTAPNALGSLACASIIASALIGIGAYTVSTLPSASANAGRIAQVTDSSVTTNGSAVAGGGSNRVMVFSNGTNWDVVVA